MNKRYYITYGKNGISGKIVFKNDIFYLIESENVGRTLNELLNREKYITEDSYLNCSKFICEYKQKLRNDKIKILLNG